MADSDAPDLDAGQTVELALSEIRERLPADPADLRNALPGFEPDREVTDWGRSERIERLVDRTLYRFLYHYWFRVDVDGIDNVPGTGGAMLVANHGGALPPDGAMIAKAILEEHPLPRAVHLATERSFAGMPGIGMLLTKLGAVSAHPANVHRLLFDERQLVLVFPEGRGGATKALSERYRMRPFDGGYVEAAMRARVPIVPVAVIGAEEAAPVFARLSPLRALTRLPSVSLAPPVPLPAKFTIRFLEPVGTDRLGPAPWEDKGLVQALSHDIRALIGENLLEMLSERRSVWLG